MHHGGKSLVGALKACGARRVFCVAGESYLPVLDGFLDYPDIQVVTCRHESGATFMAEAHASLSGEPGIALVTRGPGACNASIGVHAARQASLPVILFVGLINSADRGREAFQEFDMAQMYGSLSKWAEVIDSAERIPEYVARAFHVATSGRPGPVVLGLPEDILFGEVEKKETKIIAAVKSAPSEKDIDAALGILAGAEKPLILAGGGRWSDEECAALAKFAEAAGLPVTTAFRQQDVFDHNHPNYVGELGTGPNPALVQRVKDSDFILIIGARPDEITTQGYAIFQPGQKLIHVYPSAEVFGKAFAPDLGIIADAGLAAVALAQRSKIDGKKWAAWLGEAKNDFLAWTDIKEDKTPKWNGADLTQIYRQLREVLPKDAIVITDVGNFSGWAQRYLRYARPGRLIASIAGAMGIGVPAAVAASLECPERLVFAVCGDGGFMMTAHELATAKRYGLKPIVMVCDNGLYGTIRMHQEKEYPGRVSATELTNPDFVKLAEGYGAFGVRVDRADQFTDAWSAARKSGKAAVIHVVMDPRQINTRAVL